MDADGVVPYPKDAISGITNEGERIVTNYDCITLGAIPYENRDDNDDVLDLSYGAIENNDGWKIHRTFINSYSIQGIDGETGGQ
ncbi:hypothetical protein ACTNDZ_12290 [Selenomonas montiformis]|uniref:hypothetical protein n=1 Tax=Selenomonas montiformis TaxID=2652285 RepID=UPI003F8C9892